MDQDTHLANLVIQLPADAASGDPGGLDVDEMYLRQMLLKSPPAFAGTYTLFVMSDRYDQVFELDNENNAAGAAVEVVLNTADLVVTALTGDAAVEAGGPLNVRWTVTNQGTGDTIGSSWKDYIYASQNEVVGDGDDRLLGKFSHSGLLDPSAHYDASKTVSAPFDFDGDYHLFMVTDAEGRIFEGDVGETNNASALHAFNVTQETADLAALSASLGIENGRLRLQWQVENAGENRTGVTYWHDAVYLSTNDQFGDADDSLLAHIQHSGLLEPTEGYAASQLIDLPNDIQNDIHLFVMVDDGERVAEAGREANNYTLAGTLTAAEIEAMRTMPDLIVHAVNAPDEAISGQPFTLEWTGRNLGEFIPQEAPFPPEIPTGRWLDRVYLSHDLHLDPELDFYLGEKVIYAGQLLDVTDQGDPYQEYITSGAFRIPNGITGPIYAMVVTDRDNQVNEFSAEDNNIGSDPDAMVVSLAPLVDLVVGEINIPESASLDRYIYITYTLENDSDNELDGALRPDQPPESYIVICRSRASADTVRL